MELELNMEPVKLLLDLPFDILAQLAAGYLSYRLAFIGRDSHHTAIDVTFISLAFAAMTKAIVIVIGLVMLKVGYDPLTILPSIGAAFVVLGAAALWRRWGQDRVYNFFRNGGISDHDGQPDVWRSMLARQLKGPTRLVIKLKDGTELMCNQLAKFNDAPLGPCLLGMDGSVALYVTDVRKKGTADWEEISPFDAELPGWGYEMSFIPASEIARIDVTRPN